MKSLRLLALATAGLAALSSWTSGAPTQNAVSDSRPEVTFNIYTKKLASLVDERFLSMSVDPEQLIKHSQPGPGALRMLSMVTAMSPAYLRVAGPSTEFLGFEGSPDHVGNTVTVNDQHWVHLQNLCRTAGLRAIVALSARRRPGGDSRWDSRDAMRILGAVDVSSVAPAGWQLGYDWETLRKAAVSPRQAASDITTLKSLIEEFPTLAKEEQILLGPDVDATNTDAEAAGDLTKRVNVGAVVIRPFTTQDPTGANLEKDFANKVLGRNAKRPLWIAESGKHCTAPFSSALLWAQRLCTASRIGAQVILRELDLDAARDNATPDLWVSILHKTLTSRGILEARGGGPQAADLSTSAHCTPSSKDHRSPKSSSVSPAIRYDLGAVTIMIANPSDRALRLSLKIASDNGSVVGENEEVTVVHEYVLTALNNNLNATSSLLNGSPLQMAPGGGIPVLSPRLLKLDSSLRVSIPPRSVAFWVVPGAKARACLAPPASSEVAPAASRLRPISARGMEIGVHLDGDSTLSVEPEHEHAEEPQDTQSGESGEIPLVKDLGRRRQRISSRQNGTPRLSLPRTSSLPRRPHLDLNIGRAAREPELKTLDDFIREELRFRPGRLRASEPLKLPLVPTPSLPQIDLSAIELPALPSISSLQQIDTSTRLDPLKLNSDLQKINSDLQHSLVQQATTPIRNLVKMTDGLLDQIQGIPKEDRTIRSTDKGVGVEENPEDMDDGLRFKRKTVMDYMKEDLTKKHKKAPSEQDIKRPIPRSETLNRRRREASRHPRFAPEEMGLRLKRKPVVPEFLSLPRLPKRPLLPNPAAKRAQLLISQPNEEGTSSNSWGSTHRELFPQGDVFAGTEGAPDARDPDVDYVSDDDFPESANPGTAGHPGLEGDALYYAPGEFYETLSNQRRNAAKITPTIGEFGELEYIPGKIAPRFEDTAADTYEVVPATKPNKEQEAEIQSKLRKRMEEHYAEVQKAALDRKAEVESDEDDAPEDNMDMDSLRALAERYRKEKKLNLPQDKMGSAKGLENQPESNDMEKTADQKSRRRRGVDRVLDSAPQKNNKQKNGESAEVVNAEVTLERKGLPIRKATDLPSDSSHNTADEIRERRLEKLKAFRDRMKMSKDRPHLPLREKLGHDDQEQTDSTRHKRNADEKKTWDPFDMIMQWTKEEGPAPIPTDPTGVTKGASKIPEPKQEEFWPFNHYIDSYRGLNHRSRNQGHDSYHHRSPPPHSYLPPINPPPEYDFIFPYPPPRPPPSFSHRPGSASYTPHYGDSIENSSEESQFGHNHNNGFFEKSFFDLDPSFDVPDDVDIEDFSMDVRALLTEERDPKKFPDIVAIPWEISFPSSVRFKRSVDPGMSNTLVQAKSTDADITEAIRHLHKMLNDDSGSSEETSVEVNHEGKIIDSPEILDSLEDAIQTFLNMTKHLNDTLNQQEKNEEMVSWSDFGMDNTKVADPQLDPEEMKFRDAALAWIQAAKTGALSVQPKEKGKPDPSSAQHLTVKKELPDDGKSSSDKELERHEKLSEQDNIVTAMMQRVSVLLSELRTILNKKEHLQAIV